MVIYSEHCFQENNIKPNSDFAAIEHLAANFANSTSREDQLTILEDLEYYLHQFDNARDFVTIGGLEAVADPGLA